MGLRFSRFVGWYRGLCGVFMGVYPKQHKKSPPAHSDGCTCEKCFREWCEENGMDPKKKAEEKRPVMHYPGIPGA